MSTDHYKAAADVLALVDQAMAAKSADLESTTLAVAIAQAHATLALASAQRAPRDSQPGPCPSHSPAFVDHPDGLRCAQSAAHLGLHNYGGTKWTDAEGHTLDSEFVPPTA